MISIRRATITDLDSLVPLFDAYRQFYKQDTDKKGAQMFLTERLERGESVVFLAFDAEKPVGFTQLYPIFSSVGMRRSWLLNDLYVEVGARKKGVGERLLEEAKAWARKTGASWMMLETAADNHPAQALYEKNGWERVADELFYRVDL